MTTTTAPPLDEIHDALDDLADAQHRQTYNDCLCEGCDCHLDGRVSPCDDCASSLAEPVEQATARIVHGLPVVLGVLPELLWHREIQARYGLTVVA